MFLRKPEGELSPEERIATYQAIKANDWADAQKQFQDHQVSEEHKNNSPKSQTLFIHSDKFGCHQCQKYWQWQ